MGISVKGAIVIARYGGSWRGIKPKVAAEHGAVGCLIYSDPRDDGYVAGRHLSQGPVPSRDGAQRGSVMDMPVYPGDPADARSGRDQGRQAPPLERSQNAHQDSRDADLLRRRAAAAGRLEGPVAPESWRGALPITYHIGPGTGQGAPRAEIQLGHEAALRRDRAHSRLDSIPTSGSFAAIITTPGSTAPKIRSPGTWPLMEETRALGELLKQGWKPKRTIIYCAWDGEEPGLLGSTEWAETHAEELRNDAVATSIPMATAAASSSRAHRTRCRRC